MQSAIREIDAGYDAEGEIEEKCEKQATGAARG